MNPLAILSGIEMGIQVVGKLTELIVALKKSIDDTIPDEELRLEDWPTTVARLKAKGLIPADYEPGQS